MDIYEKINDCVWRITDDKTLVISPEEEGATGHWYWILLTKTDSRRK